MAKLDQERTRTVALPDVKQRLADLTPIAPRSTPVPLAELLDSDIKKRADVIELAKCGNNSEADKDSNTGEGQQ